MEDIELYDEKRALYYDGIMDSDYDLVRSILQKNPELINADIDVPMDQEDIDDGREMWGKTPLLSAVAFSDFKMIQILVEEFGADVKKGDYENDTAIYELAYEIDKKSIEKANYLLEKGADVNQADNTGKTPLMAAAQYGNLLMVKKLLKHSADATAVDENNSNVFYWIGYYDGKMETAEDEEIINAIIKVLIKHGADVNNIDNFGMTGLKMAEEYDKPMVAKVLKKYMDNKPIQKVVKNKKNIIPDDFMK